MTGRWNVKQDGRVAGIPSTSTNYYEGTLTLAADGTGALVWNEDIKAHPPGVVAIAEELPDGQFTLGVTYPEAHLATYKGRLESGAIVDGVTRDNWGHHATWKGDAIG